MGGVVVGGVVVGGVVVGAAVVCAGRMLVARRSHPPELAGRWELPGGRVEPGESEPAALVRECLEELGAHITVVARVGADQTLPGGSGAVLRVYAAALHHDSPPPRAVEHSAVRWVCAAELDGLDWLDADRALLPDLTALLAASEG